MFTSVIVDFGDKDYNSAFFLFSFEQKKVDVQFSEAECFKIDAENRKVYCRSSVNNNLDGKEEFVVDYDYLIVAVGANVNTFNTPGVTENCHFLKVTYFFSFIIFYTVQHLRKNC